MTSRASKGTTNADVRNAARRLGGLGGAMSTLDRLEAMERFLADAKRAATSAAPVPIYPVRQLVAHGIVLLEELHEAPKP